MSKAIALMMAVGLCAALAAPAWAAVDVAGDTNPVAGDPWWQTGGDISTSVHIGDTGDGSVVLDAGSDLLLNWAFIAHRAGSTGLLTVDGVGSTWTCEYFGVGNGGQAEVDITNGGSVVAGTYSTSVGALAGSSGVIRVDGAGSSLETGTGLKVGEEGDGVLAISNGGTVTGGVFFNTFAALPGSSSEVTIDGVGSALNLGSSMQLGLGGDATLTVSDGGHLGSTGFGWIGRESGATGKITVDGAGSTWDAQRTTVGDNGRGTMVITNGGRVDTSYQGVVGYGHGSGQVAVDGAGSTWAVGNHLKVGDVNDGRLTITRGGAVSVVYDGNVGSPAGANGVVTVDGAGSTWASGYYVDVGVAGEGVLNVSNGASASAAYSLRVATNGGTGMVNISHGAVVSIGDDLRIAANGGKGTVNLQISGDNMIAVGSDGSGVLVNDGLMRMMAGPVLAAGTYTPMTVAGDWDQGTGSFQSIGGVWSLVDKTFVNSGPVSGVNGQSIGLNLASTQRLSVLDALTGNQLAVSFDAASTNAVGGQDIVLAATNVASPPVMHHYLPTLAAWQVTTNLAGGQDALVSLEIPSWWDHDMQLSVWRNDGNGWVQQPGGFQSYGNGWASFLITGFGSDSYAVTGVPEPASMSLLALGGVAVLRRRRKS